MNENISGINFTCNNKGKTRKTIRLILLFCLAAFIGAVLGILLFMKYLNTTHLESYYNNELNESTNNKIYDSLKNVENSIVSIGVETENGFKDVGNGLIYKKDGHILTTNETIGKNVRFKVKMNDGKTLNANLVGVNYLNDIAVIKVNKAYEELEIPTFTKIKSNDLGKDIVAVYKRFQNTSEIVLEGVLSAVNQSIIKIDPSGRLNEIDNVILSDVNIGKLTSGTVLCTINGEVIGINSSAISQEFNWNFGTCISIEKAISIAKNIEEYSYAAESNMGIFGEGLPQESNNSGVYIYEVKKDSVADKAGIRPTDIIIELEGVKIGDIQDLINVINNDTSNRNKVCKVLRNGEVLPLKMDFEKVYY